MGGALAQRRRRISQSMRTSALCLTRVTIAAPLQETHRQVPKFPRGTLRGNPFLNEYDPVPTASVVGYEQAGIPMKVPLQKGARRKFKRATGNPFAVAGPDGVMPHVLYQLGTLVCSHPWARDQRLLL